jgi:hypothetical protein
MVTWNEGVLEGLKIAKVYIQREILESPNSKKLWRILVEVEKAIQQEKTNIGLQRLNEK